MKPELNKKDQSKQNKLRKMLSQEQPLSRLVGETKEKKGSGKGAEEIPDFVTDGLPFPHRLVGDPLPPWHVVCEGDTLESIAESYGVPVKRLKKLNKLSDEQAAQLKVGQKIRLYYLKSNRK